MTAHGIRASTDFADGIFLYPMLTRCHRYLTRWNRRLVFAVVIVLPLAASWRAYQARQQAQPATPIPQGQLM